MQVRIPALTRQGRTQRNEAAHAALSYYSDQQRSTDMQRGEPCGFGREIDARLRGVADFDDAQVFE
ncbi:MAG: hypothetical protein ACREUC_07920, partial [Steroidobacteraceae bacterium]